MIFGGSGGKYPCRRRFLSASPGAGTCGEGHNPSPEHLCSERQALPHGNPSQA